MSDHRKTGRRDKNRRKHQLNSFESWSDTERRSKRDRRKGERRSTLNNINIEDPNKLRKKEIELERREKERRITERRKRGRIRKKLN